MQGRINPATWNGVPLRILSGELGRQERENQTQALTCHSCIAPTVQQIEMTILKSNVKH